GRDFFLSGMDRSDKALPILRRKIRSLQPDLSRPRLHHHVAHLDVSDLFAPATWRQIERDPAPRTRTRARSLASSSRSGKTGSVTRKPSGLIARLALLRSAAVVGFRFWLATALALSGIIGTLVHAQLTD